MDRAPDTSLSGVMYMRGYGATEEELNARVPLSIAQWHEHLNLCVPQQPEQRNWLMGDPTLRAERLDHHCGGLQSGGWPLQGRIFPGG